MSGIFLSFFGGALPTFAVSPSTASVNEGSSVTFTVTTTNVSDGTTLYWSLNTVSGTVNTSDFTGAAVTGSFSISSNTGSVALTLANDVTAEGSESFQLQVRTGSTSGTIVATSSTVTINDTSTVPVPEDPGNGQGWSIGQGAGSANGSYTSTSSTNYISSWYNSAGANTATLNYACGGGGSFAYHTGHSGNSSQWPMYHAIQVSTGTYGQVINKINWYKHSNAIGNVDMWGTTRAITSGNYTDTSLYTYLGRVNMGGAGSAGDCTISTGTFNSSSYGYNWILLKLIDISGPLAYPSVGSLGGWAMFGMQLVKQ